MNSNHNKKKSKRDTLATVERQPGAKGSPHPAAKEKRPIPRKFSEEAEQAFSNWMKEVSGTEHQELQSKLLNQAVGAVPDVVGQELKSFECVAAALHGVGPKDGVEGMLAAQMVAAHMMAMECLKRAALPNQIDLGVDVNVNRSTKLMRTFASLTDALNRYRGKGEQRMTVEHVHVYQGGQAIVGQVRQNNTQIGSKITEGED
jgi:hypothetical protein